MDFTGERFVPHVEGDIRLEHMHRYLAARRLVHGKRVLDIACGEGYGSDLLAGAAAAVVGVDIDELSIAHARSTYVRPNLRFLRGDAIAIPIGDATIDVVVSFETIEHLTDHRQMMLEIKRVLGPGGVLVLSSPDRREYSDVPRFSNPYHLRELYLSELRALLEAHFSDHALYGQRVHYASVLAPAEGRCVPFVGYRDDGRGDVVEGRGLPNPVYFIAVASDGELPDLPAGCYIPPRPPYMRDIATLTEQLRAQQDAQQDAQQEMAAEAARRETSLRLELDQRGRRVDELAAHADALERELLARSAAADALRRKLASLQARLESLRGEHEVLRGNQEALRSEHAALRGEHATLLGEHRDITRQRTEAVQLVEAVYASRSWRAMAPLRRCGMALRAVRRGGYFGVAVAGRAAYHALPLPMRLKLRLKHQLFTRTGQTFAATGAYARWQDAAGRPLMAVSGPVTAAPLQVADGRWEWQGYAGMRARIAEVLARCRAALAYRPRPMIALDGEDPAHAAARIALPAPGPAPAVSIIMPVFNELPSTIECLVALAANTDNPGGPTFEVIVADDASTDRTREVLSRRNESPPGDAAGQSGLPAQLQHRGEGGARTPAGAAEQRHPGDAGLARRPDARTG